jgi:hypothetical protein
MSNGDEDEDGSGMEMVSQSLNVAEVDNILKEVTVVQQLTAA